VNLAVEAGCGYSIVFTPIKNQLRAFDDFRRIALESGRTVRPDDLIFTVIAYVAETDEEAVRECRPHVEKFFEWFHRVPPKYLSPPGYVSREEHLRRTSSAALADA
jgi:alkanesulfonate monooxygenase SsuD/methylene tetrahydromethanopterin reductase-like flavin-dependent oxidoreductase (luciferase family)